MIDMSETEKHGASYGYGISLYNLKGKLFYGHSGYYGSIVAYSPEYKVLFAANVGQSNAPFSTGKVMYNVVNIVSNKSSDE
jgi:D-alanyl-D-alanine carboxypeptidase